MNTKLAVMTGSDLRSYGGGEKDIIAWTNLIACDYITIFSLEDSSNVRLSYDQIHSMISERITIVYYDAIKIHSISDLIPSSLVSLRKILSCRNYDVIYSGNSGVFFNFLLTLLCRISGVKMILGIHLMNFFNEKTKDRGFKKRFLMSIFISFRKLVVRCQKNIRIQNRSDFNSLNKLGFKGNIFNIPPLVKSYGSPGSSAKTTNEFVCLFVARLSVWHKGIDLLAEVVGKVLSKNHNVKFHIIGSGENGEGIVDNMCSTYPENVVWKGFLSDTDLGHEYERASLFLQTSRGENFGISLAEAQMRGLPAVAFRTMGAEDIILESYQGTLIEAFDTDSFADAILNYYIFWDSNSASFEENKMKISSAARARYDSTVIISEMQKMLGCNNRRFEDGI